MTNVNYINIDVEYLENLIHLDKDGLEVEGSFNSFQSMRNALGEASLALLQDELAFDELPEETQELCEYFGLNEDSLPSEWERACRYLQRYC